MEKLFDINDAQFCCDQWCYTHNKRCPLFGSDAATDLEVAGLPCVDQSRNGARKYEEGPTGPVFISHAKRHIEKATPMIIIENVQELCCRCCCHCLLLQSLERNRPKTNNNELQHAH